MSGRVLGSGLLFGCHGSSPRKDISSPLRSSRGAPATDLLCLIFGDSRAPSVTDRGEYDLADCGARLIWLAETKVVLKRFWIYYSAHQRDQALNSATGKPSTNARIEMENQGFSAPSVRSRSHAAVFFQLEKHEQVLEVSQVRECMHNETRG